MFIFVSCFSCHFNHHLFVLNSTKSFSLAYLLLVVIVLFLEAWYFFLHPSKGIICKPNHLDSVVEEEWHLQIRSYKFANSVGFLFVLQMGALVFTSRRLCWERCCSACCFATFECYYMSLPQAFMLIINSLMPGMGGDFLFLKLQHRIPCAWK